MTSTAPYQNSMRLGQGFNSYTQQICINEAVTVENPPDVNTPPSQIVTYASRYVSKISDVTNSMNISGALNIKYGLVSGGASGSFVDSTKFQQSDINFLVTVKVINQTEQADPEALTFRPLVQQGVSNASMMTPEQFTKKFGDCFISGFQEGGEFYGLVSIKALETEKKREILAEAHIALQAGFGPETLEVSGNASVNLANRDWQKSCETTITVNWSGGGKLKDSTDKWDIDTLSAVAAKFPDLVAETPQRTTALLTKYTNLRSYVETQPPTLYPLQYENAGLYTTELMDSYVAYKAIWKNVQITLDDFDAGTVKLSAAHRQEPYPDPVDEERLLGPYTPDVDGLDKGIREVRIQMMRIVNEVDLVTDMPQVASDPEHGVPYVRPQIFKHLLPGGCTDNYSPLNDFVPPFDVYASPLSPVTGSVLAYLKQNNDALAAARLKFTSLVGNPGVADDVVSSASFLINPDVSPADNPLSLSEIRCDSDITPKVAAFTATYTPTLPPAAGTAAKTYTSTLPGAVNHVYTSTGQKYPDRNGTSYIAQVIFSNYAQPPEMYPLWVPLFAVVNGPGLPPTATPVDNVRRVHDAPEGGFALVGWWGTRDPGTGRLTGVGGVWGELATWFPKVTA